MPNRLKLFIVLLCMYLTANLAAVTAFRVLEETQDYIRIRFSLPEWKLEGADSQNQKWHRINCDYGSELAREGYPIVQAFSEAVGIPVDGDISISIISQKTETVPNVRLLPAQKTELTGEEVNYSFFQDFSAYSSNNAYPAFFAQKGDPAFIGNRHMIPLKLFPFQYRAASKELMVTTEAEIMISIQGNKTPARDWQSSSNYIDNVGDVFFLNNRTSRAWRKPKEIADFTPYDRTNSNLVSELQFIIDKEGIYKITYQYLADKMSRAADSLGIQYSWSLDTVDPRNLQLSDEYGPIAIHFSGESDGVFDASDYFEFFGDRHYGDTGYQDDYTGENVYVLTVVDGSGARMAVENGGLVESNSANYILPDAYQHSIHLEQQLIPDKLGRSWSTNSNFYREDLYFWKKITAPNLEIVPFQLQYPKDTTIRTLETQVALYGLTYMENLPPGQNDHHATIRLNQALVATRLWRDQSQQIFVNDSPLPNSYLNHGENYYYISLNGDTPMGDREQVLLDYIKLTYWREYKTSEDFIKFAKPSNRPFGLYQFAVEGFNTNQVSVYKIGSSVFNNLQIEPASLNASQPWTVTFQDSVISNDVRYYALTESQKKQPKDFRVNIPSYLKSPDNAANSIIITHRDFLVDSGTLLYKQLWEAQGHQVMLIDLQDIFDEFNFGIRSAEAIKAFLSHAYNNWAEPQLSSVLLLGDGTDDERDGSLSRKYNIIPVKKIWTYKHGATASDNWYACIVGNDPVPDISISRINVWLRSQIADVAAKSEKYFNTPNYQDLWQGHMILSSGGKTSDPNDIFSIQSEIIRRIRIPSYYRASRVYTNTQSVSNDFRGNTSDLMRLINDGAVYLQFMGHGGGRIWADYNLFNFNNVASLNNSNYPIVTSLACYCSAFDTNGASSISEALVLQPNKGAIATVGFSGLGYLYDDLIFGMALNEGLFQYDFENLGDVLNFTKAKFYVSVSQISAQQALTQGCVLLGDPMIRVVKPKPRVTVSTDKDTYAIGDTIRVTATFGESAIAARTFIMKPTELSVNPPNQAPVINNNYEYSYVAEGNPPDRYNRNVFVAGFSGQDTYYGFKQISVGRPLVTHLGTLPEVPAYSDSIYYRARINGINNITGVYCRVRLDSLSANPEWLVLPMNRSAQDSTLYTTSSPLPQQVTGKEFYFKYRVLTSDKAVAESFLYPQIIAGPELIMQDMQFISQNNNLGVTALIKNIGNGPSGTTIAKLIAYQTGNPTVILNNQIFAPLAPDESRQITMEIDTLMTSNVVLEASVNIPRLFPEWSSYDDNNRQILSLPMNYHSIDNGGGMLTSLDNNVMCEVPANLVADNQSSMFYINPMAAVSPKDQPDVYTLKLYSNIASIPYEIRTLDQSLVDSTDVFINGKKIKLTFFYSSTDQQTQQFEGENSYKIYRWEPVYRKWIMQGGNISTTDNKVVFEVGRQGIYSLLRNRDRTRPSIDVNVQDQEFTMGGYISGKGTISLLLSDANGIDVFDNSIKLFLDGVEVPENQWVKTINVDNINRIPIKYQLNLQKGDYTLVVDCKDVNGNFNTRDIQFEVNDKFDIIKLANYPNPVLGRTQDPKNAGRTRFTYVLTDDADEVYIKVYTVSGRLVKTFRNLPIGVGYHEFPRTVYAWDCTDEQGFYLANGVYFYRITARQGGKTVEKIQKMAILK
jgi:hypothetical protein